MRRFHLFAALALTACTTPYQDMGLRGGVEAQQITADTYRIPAARGTRLLRPP